jgi:hypothetical protein
VHASLCPMRRPADRGHDATREHRCDTGIMQNGLFVEAQDREAMRADCRELLSSTLYAAAPGRAISVHVTSRHSVVAQLSKNEQSGASSGPGVRRCCTAQI